MTTAAIRPPFAVDGPPDPELVRIRDLIYEAAGIFLPGKKLGLLFAGCCRRMKEMKARDLSEYFGCLSAKSKGPSELIALLNEITIGETCFFRSQQQLDALTQIVLPKILAAKGFSPTPMLKIWSAGCSTGEEPYTLSMALAERAAHPPQGWSFEIVATDLNERSLAHARQATYGAYSTRKLTSYFAGKYFSGDADQMQLSREVRSQVSFSRLNLFNDERMATMNGFDLIFCCNVLIYFDLASKRRVIQHFFNSLLPHGYLFLGTSESLFGVNDSFRLVHFPRATAYVKANRLPSGQHP